MSYIKFDQSQLVNMEYSLKRELIRSNRAGAYACTSLNGCNTRKYHGLLVAPQPAIDYERHVLLSTLDETIIQREKEFNFSIHRYEGGNYNPKGHKYIEDFEADPIPKFIYRVGGVKLAKERLFTHNNDRIIIRYTLLDAHSPTRLRFRPFMAFRNIHKLSKSNVFVDTKYTAVSNGIRMQMYQGYTPLYMQFSKDAEYTHVPDWYYNIEYIREQERGYDSLEDLFVPGFFELDIAKGESIIFSAGLKEANPVTLKRLFTTEVKRRVPRDSFDNCMINSAQQFLWASEDSTQICAGFPWFGSIGRDTFISLPGITLAHNDEKVFDKLIRGMLKGFKAPYFPAYGSGPEADYDTVDTSLWFIRALQWFAGWKNDNKAIKPAWWKAVKDIINGYSSGISIVKMQPDGLLYADGRGKPLSWMNAIVAGKAVNPRTGYAVEINALWYNALCFALELASEFGDKGFIDKYQDLAARIPQSFDAMFWNDKKAYLADFADDSYKDWSVRPNQLLAAALPYSPLAEEKRKKVVDIISSELLTDRGIRTLSPKNPNYHGSYAGNQQSRDLAYHNGCAFPWFMGSYADAYLKLYAKSGLSFIKGIYEKFEGVIGEHGVGSISELYDGDPPHHPGGSISHAISVAEIIRMKELIKQYDDK